MINISKVRADITKEVTINLESVRYSCELQLRNKLTCIIGDSGRGKTEFTRQLQYPLTKVTVSNGYQVVNLTNVLFQQSLQFALRHNKNNDKVSKFLNEYWRNLDNVPYQNCILIIDDEEFIKTEEFAVYYNTDVSNYFVIIDRSDLHQLSYSPSSIYKFVAQGKNHYIAKYYDFNWDPEAHIDYIIVEGVGSDYIFFKEMFKSKFVVCNPMQFSGLNSGGRFNVVKMIETNTNIFQGKTIMLLVDYCAFGSNIQSLQDLCSKLNMRLLLNPKYLSFEYMLLKSNLIKCDIDNLLSKEQVTCSNVEEYCTRMLREVTNGTYYAYSKAGSDFSVCYYKDCCQNQSNRGDCPHRLQYINKSKIMELLRKTDFEFLLDLK